MMQAIPKNASLALVRRKPRAVLKNNSSFRKSASSSLISQRWISSLMNKPSSLESQPRVPIYFFPSRKVNLVNIQNSNEFSKVKTLENKIPSRFYHQSALLKSSTTVESPVGSKLIPLVNQLQEVSSLVGDQIIDLPQIVVIGAQSSGKSSVLENLVGRDFLPRGSGLVTRRPLVLQLNRLEESKKQEWGEFSHKPGVKMNFDEIQKEIIAETERTLGRGSSRISSEPIILKVFSPHVLPLTLVDTPGMTRIPVGDQPTDIEQQIRNMVHRFISQPNAIILAVQPANADLATSDALKLAREVDPHGDRTIGVLTKIDLMDKGTNAMDILSGKTIPLKLGFVGIINRSQQDILAGKPIRQMLDDEHKFFKDHPLYREVVDRSGTGFLAKRCNRLLSTHIQKVLPNLRNQIRKRIKEKQEELQTYGSMFVAVDKQSQGMLLLQLVNKFSEHFEAAIDGVREISTNHLNGGARIRYILNDKFSKYLDSIEPLQGLTPQDIRTAIRNASGVKPSLFVPDKTFELLIKKQIENIREPALRCAEMVLEELLRIISELDHQEISRYRGLKERVIDVGSATVKRALKPTNKMIENIIDSELAYINTNHPDFLNNSFVQRSEPTEIRKETPRNVDTEEKDGGGFFSMIFGGNKGKDNIKKPENQKLSELPTVLKVGDPLSENDKNQIRMIQTMIKSYFNVTRRNMQDIIPKIVMNFLVNSTRQSLQKDLIAELYKEELFDALLQEDSAFAVRRKKVAEELDVLKKAKRIIQEAEVSGLIDISKW